MQIIKHIVPQNNTTNQCHKVARVSLCDSPLTEVIEQITNNKSPLLIVGITVLILVLVLVVGINVVVLVSGDAVGHLLSIGTNQVAPVLLGVATLVSKPSIHL